jgi:alpha-glucuronidase
VIQHIYDSHYLGAQQAAQFVVDWDSLRGKIDDRLYEEMRARLEYQAGHAIVWRDAIVQYFLKLSGIADEKGRAEHFPGRFEAEDARLTGYKVIDVTPWEDASAGKAVACEGQTKCAAEWTYPGAAGRFNVAAQYFDLQGGAAKFTFIVNGQAQVSWAGDTELPSLHPHGDNSTRYVVRGVTLKPGDVLRVEGVPDGADPAALDYIEVQSSASAP